MLYFVPLVSAGLHKKRFECHCQRVVIVLCVTSVLLSLSDTMIVVVCDVCVAVIVRHSFVLCCVLHMCCCNFGATFQGTLTQ